MCEQYLEIYTHRKAVCCHLLHVDPYLRRETTPGKLTVLYYLIFIYNFHNFHNQHYLVTDVLVIRITSSDSHIFKKR